MGDLSVHLEERAGVPVLVYGDGSHRPATDAEKELFAEVDRLRSWDGLMAALDEHYPPEEFGGTAEEFSDPGARVAVLMRVIDTYQARCERQMEQLRRMEAVLQPWALEPCWSPLFDGEVYHEDDHGEVSDARLAPCGKCPPCTFRTVLAAAPTEEGAR